MEYKDDNLILNKINNDVIIVYNQVSNKKDTMYHNLSNNLRLVCWLSNESVCGLALLASCLSLSLFKSKLLLLFITTNQPQSVSCYSLTKPNIPSFHF